MAIHLPVPPSEGPRARVAVQRRRRGPERDELRLQILDAVSRLHQGGGYGAVTMRSVAREVGVSAMSLYRYFPNKAALLEQVWLGVLDAALNATRAVMAAQERPAPRLRQLYAAYITFWLEHPQDFRLLFDPGSEIPSALLQDGPAWRFRREAETLIDACLGEGATPEQRQMAYDLCRIKVVGFLYTCIGLATQPHRLPAQLLDGLLDDIERQLQPR
ncbi:TetR/AcrR family transcriptional regulator [Roseateles flavus]|uniref:TetR/AcrR family transcriptional regulator n=1 Tax=Roseateles flavus TaxID=3149041 RepID=A0ABV0GB91_9BURK